MYTLAKSPKAALFSILLVASTCVSATTQHTYQSTLSVSSTGYDMAHAVAYDNSGNLFYAGHVNHIADVDPTAGVDLRDPVGNSVDSLVTKINADGSYAWSRVLGEINFDRASSLATDNAGNLYIAGQFSGSVDFNPNGVADVHTSANAGYEYDIFITKINADGSYGWTRVLGGYFYIYGKTIDVDSRGNVYVAAAYSIAQDFALEGAGDVRTPAGGDDIVLTKINADGSYGWTYTMGSTGYDMGHTVAVDANDNVYFSGHFQGTVDLDPTANVANYVSNNGSADIFMIKFDANGNYLWTQTYGGPGWDGTYTIDTDDAGNVYFNGMSEDTTAGLYNIAVSKADTNGSILWTREVGQAGFTYSMLGWDWGSAMSVDGAGNVFVTRCFINSMDFDPTAGTDVRTSNGSSDVFLTQWNSDGSYGWTYTAGGTDRDCANAVASSDFGDLAIAGSSVSAGNGLDLFVSTFKAPVETLNINSSQVKVEENDGFSQDEVSIKMSYSFDGQLDPTDTISAVINGVEVASVNFADLYEIEPSVFEYRDANIKVKLKVLDNELKIKRYNTDINLFGLEGAIVIDTQMGGASASVNHTDGVIFD